MNDELRAAAERFKNTTEAYLAEFDYPTLVPSWAEFAAAGAALGRALRAAALGEGNTDRCPTCESDDPSVCTTGYAHTHNPSMCCPDPWHSDLGADPITNPEGD